MGSWQKLTFGKVRRPGSLAGGGGAEVGRKGRIPLSQGAVELLSPLSGARTRFNPGSAKSCVTLDKLLCQFPVP